MFVKVFVKGSILWTITFHKVLNLCPFSLVVNWTLKTPPFNPNMITWNEWTTLPVEHSNNNIIAPVQTCLKHVGGIQTSTTNIGGVDSVKHYCICNVCPWVYVKDSQRITLKTVSSTAGQPLRFMVHGNILNILLHDCLHHVFNSHYEDKMNLPNRVIYKWKLILVLIHLHKIMCGDTVLIIHWIVLVSWSFWSHVVTQVIWWFNMTIFIYCSYFTFYIVFYIQVSHRKENTDTAEVVRAI